MHIRRKKSANYKIQLYFLQYFFCILIINYIYFLTGLGIFRCFIDTSLKGARKIPIDRKFSQEPRKIGFDR